MDKLMKSLNKMPVAVTCKKCNALKESATAHVRRGLQGCCREVLQAKCLTSLEKYATRGAVAHI